MSTESQQESYSRVLNSHGCIFGQHLRDELDGLQGQVRNRMDKLEKKLDRLTWAAVGVMIALMTTSLTLWLTYLSP